MIPYLPCEITRELLEPLVDRELSTADQVAVEAHLRTCRTCKARVEDLFLIGWSLRAGTPATGIVENEVSALGVVQSGVLERISAERAQSWRVRLPEVLSDMRLWWPMMGATAAVLMCFMGSVHIWRLTTEKQPNSLAAMLSPGSDSNPVALEEGISVPRAIDDPLFPEGLSADDGVYVLTAVVTQTGHTAGAELLRTLRGVLPDSARTRASMSSYAGGEALLDAVRGQRFTPAQYADGRVVAVRVVLIIERTTIRETWRPLDEIPPVQPVQQARRGPKPPSPAPTGIRSAVLQGSARA